jgi:Ca2+-binding RTX toxin-like protein
MRGRSALLAVASVAVLAVAAPAASATELQDASGDPYTGTLAGALSGNAVFTTDVGTITCNQSAFSGDVTGAGSPGNPAIADVDSIDWENNGSEACPSGLAFTHQDFTAGGLPWSVEIDWLSDNTAGAPNGVATLSGVSVAVAIDGLGTCTYGGDFNDSAGSGNQVRVDVYNPDNPGPDTRLAFSSEPFQLTSGTVFCPGTSQATATYNVTGDGGEKLRVTGTRPAPGPGTGTQPAATAAPPPTCKGKPASIVGTNGNDVRKGTSGKDVIVGLGGNDTLSGLAGNDVICGGAGKDTLKGGKGKDTLLGQKGKDTLKGGAGKDKQIQ